METNGRPGPRKSGAMQFVHLRLENWRNFRTADVPLESRVFLVGPNASGKSNFLDVFRFLHDIVTVGGLREAVERRGGVSLLRSLAARRYPDILIEVRLAHRDQEPGWTYTIRFNQDNLKRPIVKQETVAKGDKIILTRPDAQDKIDQERLTQTHLEQVNANREFRDLAEFFASTRYLHIVPQLVREPDRSMGRASDPYGGDFLEQVAATPQKTQAARLRRIRDALRIAVPQLKDLELWRDIRGTPHLRGLYEHWRPNAGWQTEDQFSDGTLRLLGLLWSLLDGKGPLLLEEPELSLHPEVIRVIPQIMARVARKNSRQIMVSTHSPELLRDDGIGLDEVLLLLPASEGTRVRTARDVQEVVALLEGGSSMADAVMPWTSPKGVQQLTRMSVACWVPCTARRAKGICATGSEATTTPGA